MSEAETQQYKTFNEFFTRTLKPTARPIDTNPNSIISPCDGTIVVIENLTKESEVLVKGKSFNLAQFLQNQDLAREYEGGTFVLIYLGPWNYHRFHFPVAGYASLPCRIKGRYDSVHPFTYFLGIQPLVENERHTCMVYPHHQQPIIFIPVGALFVGAIHELYKPCEQYPKGAQMGYFAFGGSTIVMIFKKDSIKIRPDLVTKSFSTNIKMGEAIAWFNKPHTPDTI